MINGFGSEQLVQDRMAQRRHEAAASRAVPARRRVWFRLPVVRRDRPVLVRRVPGIIEG